MELQVYDTIGVGYGAHRKPDPRIAARIEKALGVGESILNIGAGSGSYEPARRRLVAVEPSSIMIEQRQRTAAPCVQAVADALPFGDDTFDAAMAVLTIHHWQRLAEGLREVRRVTRGAIVILTWDPDSLDEFWLTRDYLPEILEQDRARFPAIDRLEELLGPLRVETLRVPHDCTDGFRGAFWRRPDAYLDPGIRRSISSFAPLDESVLSKAMARLDADLKSGAWARRNADIIALDSADLGYRIVIAEVFAAIPSPAFRRAVQIIDS